MRGRWSFSIYLFWHLLSASIIAKDWQVPFTDTTVETAGKKIALVLGAGPSGMIAANAILKAKTHDMILIVEKRHAFSRYNMVNFFPESWPMLRFLGIAEDFSAVSTPTDYFSFYFDYPSGVDEFKIDAENTPDSFDYRAPVSALFARPRVGLQVVQIAALQHRLAMSLSRNARVHFIEGQGEVSLPDASRKHSVRIKTSSDEYEVMPDIIVIAEGAHSHNRAHLGIAMKPVLKPQFWCSGSVSLAGINRCPQKFIQVVERLHVNSPTIRTFGIFHVREETLFLNGQATTNTESVEACLDRNAISLLEHLPRTANSPRRSLRDRHFEQKEYSQALIAITPSKAERFSVGTNVILFGDAAGHGTPKGGIGLSMITSTYPQALLDLLTHWQKDRVMALRNYDARVGEIVDYWHDRIASDDKVL